MNRQRLERIRDHLRDNVPDENFDLRSYAGNSLRPWNKAKNLCGTTACLMGHATDIPEFKTLGLYLENHYNGVTATLHFNDNTGVSAIVEFLDISIADAHHLCFDDSYPNKEKTTRQEVIDRLDAYVLNHQE